MGHEARQGRYLIQEYNQLLNSDILVSDGVGSEQRMRDHYCRNVCDASFPWAYKSRDMALLAILTEFGVNTFILRQTCTYLTCHHPAALIRRDDGLLASAIGSASLHLLLSSDTQDGHGAVRVHDCDAFRSTPRVLSDAVSTYSWPGPLPRRS